MESNFTFLKTKNIELYDLAVLAESYVYSDPNTCLYKCGLFAETVVNRLIEYERMTDSDMFNNINILRQERIISANTASDLHDIRKYRNGAAHKGNDIIAESRRILKILHSFAVWYHQIYVDRKFETPVFRLPEFKTSVASNTTKLLKKEFFINEKPQNKETFEEYLKGRNCVVMVTLFYENGLKELKKWRVNNFTEKSNLSNNLHSGFLRNWKQKGIIGIKLEV